MLIRLSVYRDCLTYIQSLVDSGDFVFEAKDCKTDEVQDECGHWIDDIISHVISVDSAFLAPLSHTEAGEASEKVDR